MGNLKSLSNFRCFLFHESLKARVLKDKSPGQWVRDQVGSWYETLRQNTNKRKERKKPMYKFLNYDDVDGLFASKPFIRAWLDPKQKEQITKDLVGDKYKTFREKSNAHLFGIISYLSCFRNYYFLALATIIQLTIVWTLTMEWWYVKLAAGSVLAGLCICFKFLLDFWLRPKNVKARAAKRPDSTASVKPLKEVVVVDDTEATTSDPLIKKKTAKDYLREAASISSLLVILCVKSGFDWGLLKVLHSFTLLW